MSMGQATSIAPASPLADAQPCECFVCPRGHRSTHGLSERHPGRCARAEKRKVGLSLRSWNAAALEHYAHSKSPFWSCQVAHVMLANNGNRKRVAETKSAIEANNINTNTVPHASHHQAAGLNNCDAQNA